MKTKPKVLVLKTDGINRDGEMAFAFESAGGEARVVHINDLRSKKESLKKYDILAIPGGFSYGDHVVSGKILAVELSSFFSEELKKFMQRKTTAILGVCNGFQILVRTGVLPFGNLGEMSITLTNNDKGKFESRWIDMKIDANTKSFLLQNIKNRIISVPIAHGEGKFFADDATLTRIEKENLVAFRYVDKDVQPTQEYPMNPNGSLHAIAGICDKGGRVLGLMPHPECYVRREQHPNWRRIAIKKPDGLLLFENIVETVKNL